MPLHIQKKGGKYCVVDPAGKQFGCHPSKKQAIDQIAAIEMSKKRRGKGMNDVDGVELVAAQRIKVIAQELDRSHGLHDGVPPIVIMSDGTPEGTVLMINGQHVPAKRLSLYCSNNADYPNCDISITLEETDHNGLVVEKTMTLRKTPPPEVAAGAKVDPEAKVRNRGKVVFESTHPKVTDNKDHFPINDANQARNALARVAQFSAAPKWWSGSLKQLQSAVKGAVSKAYPGIKVTE